MLNVAVLVDPLPSLKLATDTTLDLVRCAFRRGHSISVFHPDSLHRRGRRVGSYAAKILSLDPGLDSGLRQADPTLVDLQSFDVLLARQDPPVDMSFLTNCHLLAQIEDQVTVFNRPSEIISCPEKLYPANFPGLFPETLISRSVDLLREFRDEVGDIVLKPLYDFCGAGVFIVSTNDKNFSAMVEMLLKYYGTPIVAQKYLADVRNGDKRVFLIGGEVAGAINRVPRPEEGRANLMRGGIPEHTELSEQELEMCRLIGGDLNRRGLAFVGLDIIGGLVTEINTTSPTGIVQARAVAGVDVGARFWEWVETAV